MYDSAHWNLFRRLRDEAFETSQRLPLESYVFGSLARGDVHAGSDIDIIMFEPVSSYLVELNLDYESREIIQATPNAPIKAHIHVSDRVTVTFPMVNMTETERDFYGFSGCIGSERITDFDREPGVSKKLLLIEPTEKGHDERALLDDPYGCRRVLGVSSDIIDERVRVLTRRDKVGRTGVFLKSDVMEGESIEEHLKAIADRNNIVRRMLKRRRWSTYG